MSQMTPPGAFQTALGWFALERTEEKMSESMECWSHAYDYEGDDGSSKYQVPLVEEAGL